MLAGCSDSANDFTSRSWLPNNFCCSYVGRVNSLCSSSDSSLADPDDEDSSEFEEELPLDRLSSCFSSCCLLVFFFGSWPPPESIYPIDLSSVFCRLFLLSSSWSRSSWLVALKGRAEPTDIFDPLDLASIYASGLLILSAEGVSFVWKAPSGLENALYSPSAGPLPCSSSSSSLNGLAGRFRNSSSIMF